MKKKVMFISAANSIHTVRWVNSLSKKYEVHLVYCCNHKPSFNVINSNIILHELKFSSPYGYYLNCLQLKRIYKSIKPDLINVHYASGYGTLMRFSGIHPEILSIWGSDVYSFPNKSRIHKYILKKNIKNAKSISSTSENMKRRIKQLFPELDKIIYVVPFGVDIDKFSKFKDRKENNNIIACTLKSLKSVYGLEYGIKSIRIIKDKLISDGKIELANSIKYYIYGLGPEYENLKRIIKENNLNDAVFLKGHVNNKDVPKVLNKVDIYLAPSIEESFGVSAIEAMACQVPVIASDAEGFCEIIENGKDGIIVHKKNSEEIAENIEKLLFNSTLTKNIVHSARKKVLDKYDWTKNVQKMIEVYEGQLVKKK